MAWRPSGVQNRPFLGVFSATQPHKGNGIIETYGAGDGNRTHVRSLGSLQFNSKNAGLAAFLRFSERPNWKIMENGKRPARGERKLLQSVRRPGALQERISAFPALSNRESHTSRFPASFPFTGHKRVCRYLSGGQFPVSRSPY